jgi:hypothetical protein
MKCYFINFSLDFINVIRLEPRRSIVTGSGAGWLL